MNPVQGLIHGGNESGTRCDGEKEASWMPYCQVIDE